MLGADAQIITSSNGKDAWERIQEWLPEMVITDIKMPKMDGLELLQKVKEQYEGIYVVMLTSYSEFEYAREAIKYKANEYVLKNEINENILKKIITQCEEQNKKKTSNKSRKYLKDMIEQSRKTGEIDLNMEITGKSFVIAFRESEGEIDSFSGYMNPFITSAHKISYDQETEMLICAYQEKHSTAFCFGEAIAFCQELATIKGCTVGFSGLNSDWLEACEKAYQALQTGFYETHQRVLCYEECKTDLRKIYIIHKDVISLLYKERQEEAEELLADWIQEIGKQKIPDKKSILLYVCDIIDAYKFSKVELANSDLEYLCEEEKEKIMNVKTFGELKLSIEDFIQKIQGMTVESHASYSGYVKNAIAYIHTHYDTIETMTEVANYVNINTDYFCKIFKKETGENFNTYLTKYRIEKAIYYLTESEMKVYEVGEKVGYPNMSYFSRVFKKVTGVSPFFYKKTT